MEFEIEWQLKEFTDVKDQYFDEDGNLYSGIIVSSHIMEMMHNLINSLSERGNELEPVIKQQIKKSLPIHGVVKSLPQDNFCQVCNLPTDGVKCYSKRCPV